MPKEYVKTRQSSVTGGFMMPDADAQGGNADYYYKTTDFREASKYLDPALESLIQFATFPMSRIDPGGIYRFGNGNAGAPALSWAADSASGRYLIGVSNIGESI